MANDLITTFGEEIKKRIVQYKDVLPSHIDEKRFRRVICSVVAQEPKLLKANRASLLAAVMDLAQIGLLPEPSLQQAHLVPYAGEVKVIIGYKGYITLARQSGEIEDIYAYPVFQRDEFKYLLGLHRDIIHRPATGDRGEFIGAYAVANLKSGGFVMDYLSKDEILKHKPSYVKSTDKENPWNKWPVEMYVKTVIRHLSKYLPQSIQRVAAFEEQNDIGNKVHIRNDDIVMDADVVEYDDLNSRLNEKQEPNELPLIDEVNQALIEKGIPFQVESEKQLAEFRKKYNPAGLDLALLIHGIEKYANELANKGEL